MRLEKAAAAGIALLVISSVMAGSAVAATADTTTEQIGYTQQNGAQYVGDTVTLKTNGSNPAADWTVLGPDGTALVEQKSTSSITFEANAAGSYDVSFTVPDGDNTTYNEVHPAFDISKQRDYVKLSSPSPSSAKPGEAVSFSATDSSGAPINGTLEFSARSVAINGTTEVTFQEAGEFEVTLNPTDTETTDYYVDSSQATYERNVSVSYDTVDLAVAAYDDSNNSGTEFAPSETVQFKVTTAGGTPVADAEVAVDNQTLVTDGNGYTETTFDSEGAYEATAVKATGDGTKYTDATVALDIAYATENLSLSVMDSETNAQTTFNASEQIQFKVTGDSGNGVENVEVAVGAATTVTTDSNGQATASVNNVGSYTVTASKANTGGTTFASDSVGIDVLSDGSGSGAAETVTLEGISTVAEGASKSFDVVLSEAPNGINGYDVTVSVPGTTNATVTDATYNENFGTIGNATVSGDGTSVNFKVTDIAGYVDNGDLENEDILLGTVEVTGQAGGKATLSPTVNEVENGTEDPVGAVGQDTELEVIDVPTLVGTDQPADNDGDGVYEDLNGNGETDYSDAVTLYETFEEPDVQDNTGLFDLTGDGSVGFGDVIRVYEMTQTTN
jgi:hypothetical protein